MCPIEHNKIAALKEINALRLTNDVRKYDNSNYNLLKYLPQLVVDTNIVRKICKAAHKFGKQ